MSILTRRGFFGRLAAVAVGAVAALHAKPARAKLNINRQSARYVQHYDINSDRMPQRIDVLYGVGTFIQSRACRVGGA